MRFLKRKWGYGFDDVNEDDRLYWAVLGCNWAVFDCTGLSSIECKHNTILNNNREGSPAPRRRIDSKQMLNLPDGAERRLLVCHHDHDDGGDDDADDGGDDDHDDGGDDDSGENET